MDELINRKLRALQANRKNGKRYLAFVLSLCMMMGLGTAALLTRNGVAQTYQKKVLVCPYAGGVYAHVHNEDCYDETGKLVCPLPELEAHYHTEACYETVKELSCGLEESEGHSHTDACYTLSDELLCGLEESEGHKHTDECYAWYTDIVCGLGEDPDHIHDESCQGLLRGELICPLEESEGHTHTESCYARTDELVCDLEESEGHSHDESCCTTRQVCTCGLAGIHVHGTDCYDEAGNLICGQQELTVHVHGPECFETVDMTEEEIAAMKAAEEAGNEEHYDVADDGSSWRLAGDPEADLETPDTWSAMFEDFESSGDWSRDLLTVAESQLGYGESEANYALTPTEAVKGYTRYGAWYGIPYGDWCAMFVSFCIRWADIDAPYMPIDCNCANWILVLQEEGMYAPEASYLPKPGDLVFYDFNHDEHADHVGIVEALDTETDTLLTIEGNRTNAVELFTQKLSEARVLGWGILPEQPADYIPLRKLPAAHFEASTETVTVTVDAPAGAFPAGVEMRVHDVVDEEILAAASGSVNAEVMSVQAVDITFVDADGNELEPRRPVQVVMTLNTPVSEGSQTVVHVDDTGTGSVVEQAENSAEGEVAFQADAFSVYAIVYTVDFEYSVNGKTYQFSLPGGGAISFTDLVEVLGILDETNTAQTPEDTEAGAAARKFVADVERVTFSSPYLIWAGKTEAETTVGELKEANWLACEYSAELTEEMIARINAQPVEAGDWVLVSLHPFTSEETLTVTMKDGGVFRILVTDGQITTRVLTADGASYEITVTYGEDAKIPDGARLAVKEITEEEAYQDYVSRTGETLGRDLVDSYARFFDISILDEDGKEIQPAAEVKVQIRLLDQEVKENMEVVHFGQSPELMDISRDKDLLRFDTKGFSVFAVVVIDTEEGSYVFHGDGYTVTVTHTAEAKLPLGTILTVRELDPESDAYIQRLGQAWFEVNREYFEVEEMLSDYNEGMGDLPELNIVNLDAARFFDISFEHNGEKIEPEDAVCVEISYDEGLKALGDCKPVSGVAHFGEKAVELIEDVKTETDKDGGIVSFQYEQSSFSDTGTFVGQETYDTKSELHMAAAPVYDPSHAITLSSLGTKKLLGAGKGDGNTASNALLGSSEDLPSPASSKTLTPNNDGTYTLTLSVAGSSRSTNTAEVTRSNVLIVMDRSSSMVNNKVKIYTEYNGNPQSGVTYYGKEGDGYFQLFTYNNRYYKNKSGDTYSDRYTGQVYTATEGDRRLDAEQAALSSLLSQLLAKNNEFKQDSQGYLLNDNNERVLDEDGQPIKVNDIIEVSVISFADRALGNYPRYDGVGPAPNYGTEVDWSTDFNTLMAGVNQDNAPSGTNWEDALRYAQYVADTKHTAQPDEPVFIVFLTDGEPTAYAGETGGAKHYNDVGGGFEAAYVPAKDDARALVTSGYEFYGIFTYGLGEAQIGFLKRLVNVAYGHEDNTAQTDDLTEHFHDAADTNALLSAFEHILSRISGTIAVGNVTVADGMTTDATASTLVSGKTDGFRYTVTGPVGDLYSVTATGSDSDPTVKFTINGQDVPGVKKTEQVTRNQVDDNGNPIPDPNNPGKYLTVTEEKTYYSATVGTTEYKMTLASIGDDGQITWDLSAVGTLLSGYSYNCSFVVWPEQEAYDYVAGLNNGLEGYEWDQDAATAVLDDNGSVVYYAGGVTRYPSIVKYPNGVFSVLTNTNQSVTYSIVDTKTDETTGHTETTYDGPYTKPLEYPDPMELTGSSLSITKYWDDSMDPKQLKELVEDYAAQHDGAVYSVTLTMYENGDKYKDYTFFPVWDEAKEQYTWKSADFSIAPALLVSKHPGGSQTYKTVKIGGVWFYVLNDGHEYTLDEEAVDYHFEFSADSYHPALVDGVLYNAAFEVDDGGHIVSGSTATLRGGTLETFTGTNTLKGRLYVKKETVVPEGAVGVDLEALTFDVIVTLTDGEGAAISSPKDGSGNYDAEAGLMYRIQYGPNNPAGGEYNSEYGNYGRSGKMPVVNGVITETLYAGDEIYVGNMPVGTHYEVEETSMPLGWKQLSIAAKNEDGTADPDQIIYGNKADYVTITNTLPSFDVNILKTSADGQTPLGGAAFKLFGADYYVTDDAGKKVVNESAAPIYSDLVSEASTGLIQLGQLGGGEYYLVETLAPEGYQLLTEPVAIVVDGTSDQTRTYDDAPTIRPVYVTYTQTGNSLSSGAGVAITATELVDESGAAIVDGNGNHVYSYTYTLTVTNNSGYELPEAGGPGAGVYRILGGLLLGGSALTADFLFRRRRKEET